MEPLLEAGEMRELDRWAISEKKVAVDELMERAGEGLAGVVARRAPAGRIAIVCGKGNNGGDGIVAARLLRQAGREVEVHAVWPPEWMGEDAQAQIKKLPGPAPIPFEAGRLNKAHVIVDALLGTGSSGVPREPAAEVIKEMEEARAPVIAADIPSGVDATTGEVAGRRALRRDRRVPPAQARRVDPARQGVRGRRRGRGDRHPARRAGAAGRGADRRGGAAGHAAARARPRRSSPAATCSSSAARAGLTGAPSMSALAAMRAGAGYVTVGAPASLELSFTVRLLEAMMVGLPEDGDGHLDASGEEQVLKAVGRADAVVLGPGLSKDPDAQALARAIVPRIDVPLVIDADGLNAMAGHVEEIVAPRRWPTILTPHSGELARLLDTTSEEVERSRLRHAREAAAIAHAFVVLKGDDTLVAAPSGRVAISRGRAPGLATAGTGDVLSGVIGAMLAKGMPVAQARVRERLRARAGGADRRGAARADGVIASDVIGALPAALSA